MANKFNLFRNQYGTILMLVPTETGFEYRTLTGEKYNGDCENLFPFCCAKDGLSAYEVAVNNGFTGTEQEWIDSLRGQDGLSVDHISLSNSSGNVDTYTAWGDAAEIINLGTFTVTNGTNGIDGINGTNGVDGTNGTDGIDGITPQPIWAGTELSWDLTGDGNSDTTPVDLQGPPGTGGGSGDNWGSQVIQHASNSDSSGDGTTASPLNVNVIQVTNFQHLDSTVPGYTGSPILRITESNGDTHDLSWELMENYLISISKFELPNIHKITDGTVTTYNLRDVFEDRFVYFIETGNVQFQSNASTPKNQVQIKVQNAISLTFPNYFVDLNFNSLNTLNLVVGDVLTFKVLVPPSDVSVSDASGNIFLLI